MLLELKVKNFLSFKDEVIFNLMEDKNKKKGNTNNYTTIISGTKKIKVLKTSIVFGANASGKSNLFKILGLVKLFVINSFTVDFKVIPFNHFKLNDFSYENPTSINVKFSIKNKIYEYGFSIMNNKVISEKLDILKGNQSINLFERNGKEINTNIDLYGKVGNLIKENNSLRDNSLFLSTTSIFNNPISQDITNFFQNNLHIISGLQDIGGGINKLGWEDFNMFYKLNDENFRKKVEIFLKVADFSIYKLNYENKEVNVNNLPIELRNIITHTIDPKSSSQIVKTNVIQTLHEKFDLNKNSIGGVELDFDSEESEGTKQYISLLGPIIDCLENGSTLFIDEMTSKLHPNISKFIISLFNSEVYNEKSAQLVFNTHDISLLDLDIFLSLQINFVEKNRYGESNLFTLKEFGNVKKHNLQQKYLDGNFGSVPFIDEYLFSLENYGKDEK